MRLGPARDGKVYVLYGSRPDLIGWAATVAGRPGRELSPASGTSDHPTTDVELVD